MKIIKFVSFLILATAMLLSCAKYDEGSNFSLLTAKGRMVNTWTMTKYEVDGVDQTNDSPGLEIEFYRDDTYKRTFNIGFLVSDKGKWNFMDGKSKIILTKNDGVMESYQIIQLKNKDLKVQRVDNSTTYTYTFKGK